MIDGIGYEVDAEAVVVVSDRPLRVLSSALAGGGFASARAVVNLHVGKDHPWEVGDTALEDFARRRGIPAPWVGLMTSAWTEKAEVVVHRAGGVTALAIVTVGLGNAIAAGSSPMAAAHAPSTINAIVVVDADPEPAAMVNAVMSVTEAKSLALVAAGILSPEGEPASGTSTDAVVVAATGHGPRCRFGGPISDLGWAVARATRLAVSAGARRWVEERR